MKLRSLGKPTPQELIERDMYHCCRWCKWGNSDGYNFRCTNPTFEGESVSWVYKVTEDGHLSDTLNEALHSVPQADKKFETDLVRLLQTFGVSAKRVKEFSQEFQTSLTEYLDLHLKEVLDDHISKLYANQEDDMLNSEFQGVIIKDPSAFYCKEFW